MSIEPDPAATQPEDRSQQSSGTDQAQEQEKEGFTFTDPGCRTEIRLGTLLMLAAVFLWLWLGPATSSLLYFIGLPLVLVGVPLQALQGRRFARPGYPLKLGLVLTLGGLAMMWDLRFREVVGGPLGVQPVAPMLFVAGLWMLAWWPVSRPRPATQGVAA